MNELNYWPVLVSSQITESRGKICIYEKYEKRYRVAANTSSRPLMYDCYHFPQYCHLKHQLHTKILHTFGNGT